MLSTTNVSVRPARWLVLVAASFTLASCGGKAKRDTVPTTSSPPRPTATSTDERPRSSEVTVAKEAPSVDVERPTFGPIYFAFDSSDLSQAARDELERASRHAQRAGVTIRIEGHTDERGTTEYNLALGQRRADAVKTFLARLGVDAARLSTITFGEERPAVDGDGEDAWGRNRRAELRLTP